MARGDPAELSLVGHIVAVLGGDGRELEIARALVEAGADVRVCGVPLDGSIIGVNSFSTVAEATRGVDIVICPIPVPHPNGSLFAPSADRHLIVDAESLAGMRRGGLLITGKASTQMRQAASELALRLREYENEEDLMLLRAPAIAEGAIRIAIEHTDVTLHGNRCLIVGFGKIGPVLAATLRGLGARVTIAARNPVQRARAYAWGCDSVPLEDLPSIVPTMVVIFNTAPARLFTKGLLEHVGRQAVLIDLSAPPGGVDLDAARELRVRTIWARGLGGRAPRTVGRSQWMGVRRIIGEEFSQEGATSRPSGHSANRP